MSATQASTTLAANGIDLVDEDDAGCGGLCLLEEVTHAARANAHEHLHEVRARNREERLASHSLCEQGLAGARRANEQHAVRNLGTHLLVALRLAQEVADLLELLHGLVDAGDVGELYLGPLLLGCLRLGFGEVHRAAVLLAHAAHVVDKDPHQEQRWHHGEQDGLPRAAVGGVDGERGLGVLGHELVQRIGTNVVALELLELGLVALVVIARPVVARDAAIRRLKRERAHAVVLDCGHKLVGCKRVYAIRGGKRGLAG